MKKIIKIFSLVTTLLALASCVPNVSYDKHISIYYINDTHGAFSRQNTEANYYEAGMSYISSYLKGKKNENTLILSGGDMFQGGIESNDTKGDIMIDAMNEIGFNAMTLGNHEFDWGEECLEGFKEKLNCPILSCNTFYSSDYVTRPSFVSPYAIFTLGDVKVGIIGAVMANIGTSITGSIASKFYFPDPVPYVKHYSDYLRNDEKCDIVVASFHDGGFNDYRDSFKFESLTYNSHNTNKKYVDAIFLAHDHRKKEGSINGVPYIESACNGRNIGEISFSLKNTNGVYSIVSKSYSNIYAYQNCTVNDPNIDALLDKYKDIIHDPDEVICNFNSEYSKETFTTLISKAMYWYINENVSDFGGENVYFASHNTGGVRVSSIDSGDFTYRNLITVMPFDNPICIQTCNYSNIIYMNSSSYYRCYYESDSIINLPFADGLIKAVTISYIAESKEYQDYVQQSYVRYDNLTAKDALVSYLKTFDDIL